MKLSVCASIGGLLLLLAGFASGQSAPARFPVDRATGVNPDTHLVLTFSSPPTLGSSGQIRIYDAVDDRLVDTLDLSIPPSAPAGPRGTPASYTPKPYEYASGRFTNANTVAGTPSGIAVPTPRTAQLTIIGGFTDGFHFYPVIIHDSVATIYLHNNLVEYNKTYYVQVDPGVLSVSDGGFSGIGGKSGWTFSTKKLPPSGDSRRLVVSGDGSGDFNTVQGAVDFIPDKSPNRFTIFIKNGTYEEIVYFRNKTNITFLGEDRVKVVVGYANNEVFNPHPANVSTNEWPGTFPSRRAAFMADNSSGIHLVNFSIRNFTRGQAEGLLVTGGKNIVSNMNITGSGDALQINDSIYLADSHIIGDGDTILGRGPALFERCELNSRGAFMWIRNTAANHGWIFLNCRFEAIAGGAAAPVLARAPTNGGRNYSDAEVVLINCALGGISPAGWGPLGGDTTEMHFWEFNSTNVSDGKPVDVSQRLPASRQLTMEKDADTIANYSNPAYVLGGWTPAMAPLMLKQPAAVAGAAGQDATFTVQVASVPAATYQWLKNGAPIGGATQATLKLTSIRAGDAGRYSVTATNSSGVVTSEVAELAVK